MKIVILHGWNQNKNFWKEFQSQFSDGEVIVFNLPGFGDEPLVSEEWNIPEYAAWVRKKVEGLGENSIVLLGHSFGGRIASLLASQRPNWLKGLILYGAPALYRPKPSVRLKIVAAKIAKRMGFSRPSGNGELRDADNKKMGRIFRRAVLFDQTELLANIDVPTLLIWGSDDHDVPLRIAQEMKNLISGSNLVIMDNVGHNAHLENSNLFYGTVKKFLKNL
jgi:pimeloyl-ACP methyl ester carboxylesterase